MLAVCIWFQGRPLGIGQPIKRPISWEDQFYFSQQYLAACSSLFRDIQWDFPFHRPPPTYHVSCCCEGLFRQLYLTSIMCEATPSFLGDKISQQTSWSFGSGLGTPWPVNLHTKTRWVDRHLKLSEQHKIRQHWSGSALSIIIALCYLRPYLSLGYIYHKLVTLKHCSFFIFPTNQLTK